MPTLRAPIHAITVHFTVALTTSSFAFDALAAVLHDRSLADAGWWTLAGAGPATLAALISGAISRRRVAMGEGTARRFLRLHMALGPVFFGLLLMVGLWRWTYWTAAAFPSAWYLAGLAGTLLLMGAQGYLGGELVYAFGVNVRGSYPRLGGGESPASPERIRANES